MTIPEFQQHKHDKKKLIVVTAYDAHALRAGHCCSAAVVVMGPVPHTWITAGSSLAPS